MDEKESSKEEAIIEERKRKFVSFLKKSSIWTLAVLFIIVLISINIRMQPMKDHGGRPGLWDITTNTWTLGPDLDPFFFMRYAQIIVEEGSLPAVDAMRNVPLGFDPSQETRLLPYMIAWTYFIFHSFDKSVNVSMLLSSFRC